MKQMEAWEMEAVLIFAGIAILLVAAMIGFLVAKSSKIEADQKEEKQQIAEEDLCETCHRWYECNGVDDGCPLRRKEDG